MEAAIVSALADEFDRRNEAITKAAERGIEYDAASTRRTSSDPPTVQGLQLKVLLDIRGQMVTLNRQLCLTALCQWRVSMDLSGLPINHGFSSRNAHALALCEHLAERGAAVAIISIEWEGGTYEVSVVLVQQGLRKMAKTRSELEFDPLHPLLQAMEMYGAKETDLHVCGQCKGTGYTV